MKPNRNQIANNPAIIEEVARHLSPLNQRAAAKALNSDSNNEWHKIIYFLAKKRFLKLFPSGKDFFSSYIHSSNPSLQKNYSISRKNPHSVLVPTLNTELLNLSELSEYKKDPETLQVILENLNKRFGKTNPNVTPFLYTLKRQLKQSGVSSDNNSNNNNKNNKNNIKKTSPYETSLYEHDSSYMMRNILNKQAVLLFHDVLPHMKLYGYKDFETFNHIFKNPNNYPHIFRNFSKLKATDPDLRRSAHIEKKKVVKS